MPDEAFDFSNKRLRFDPQFNLRWFDETPGFDELYGTMSDILTPNGDGRHLSAEEALAMWRDAEKSVVATHGISKEEASLLGRTAFTTALNLPGELEVEIIDIEK